MGQQIHRTPDGREVLVVEEPRRPAVAGWILLFVGCLAVAGGTWLWYRTNRGNAESPFVVGGNPSYRYVMVREGDRTRLVGGTAMSQSVSKTVDPVTGATVTTTETRYLPADVRAQRIVTVSPEGVDAYVGPKVDQAVIGQPVRFENVRVHEAVGDKTFSIHSGSGGLLVFFPEPDDQASERAIQIRGGDTVTLTGVVRPMPDPATARRRFGLSSNEADQLRDRTIYIDAYQVSGY